MMSDADLAADPDKSRADAPALSAAPDPAAARLPVKVPLVTQPMGILQTVNAARKNILLIIPEIATTQPMVSGKMGRRWHMVMDPAALRHVLVAQTAAYPKSDVTKNLLRPAIGESLFVAEGAHWRWQRRAAAPAFSHRNIHALAPVMSAVADATSARIRQQSNLGKRAVDMAQEMARATFDVISDVTFSGGEGFSRDEINRAINNYIDEAARVSLLDVIGVPTWVPRPARLMSRKILRETQSMADAAIRERRARGASAIPDLLDLLLAGSDPDTGRAMNDAELRDNLLTFIVAGHETTALTLAWALYLMAFDPARQAKARTEAAAVLGSGSRARAACADDLARLPYIRQIIDETLRLYPPAALLARTAQKRDTLCERAIHAGDTITIPVYALHRNRLLWEAPDAFIPERFEGGSPAPRFAYLPFGDGPRICIGASFALQEAVIILATQLARFDFAAVAGKSPDPVMILTLRPEGGVWLTATPLPDADPAPAPAPEPAPAAPQ